MGPDTVDRDLAVARTVLEAVPPASPAELAALRRATAERTRVPSGRRPRLLTRPWRLTIAVGAIAAVGLAAMALAPTRGGGGAPASLAPSPASAAEQLKRALTFDDSVVHYRMVGDVPQAAPASTDGGATTADPGGPAIRMTYERWETAGGSLTLADEGTGTIVERSRTGDRVAIYSPARNEIVSAGAAAVGDVQEGVPSLAEIVDGLRSGSITAREATFAGRAVLEVSLGDRPVAVTVFDAHTFRPIEVRYGPGSAYRYEDYSVVPRTDDSLAGVDLASRHPDARVVDDAALYSTVIGELYANG